ncbi:D-amino acid dehydrogenase [Carnimonas sp. R-84981]|uniref:NAD(P)/FAD-dependent oxidoreductase n=1 Tax=Carnimonas bestiolae TaxID=3402172 RepID=UPI003EDC5675
MATSIVLGAGMVGVSTALALQQRGDDVLLVDRKGIGRETSYGNAGAIQTEACEPTAFPRSVGFLLKAATKQHNMINWHPRAVIENRHALWGYWKNSAPARHAAISQWYARFTAKAEKHHAPLAKAADAEHLIRRSGYIAAFRQASTLESHMKTAERLKQGWDVPVVELSDAQVHEKEPALNVSLAGGLWFSNVWTCQSPGALTSAYGELFKQRGGSVAYGDAMSLAATEDGGWSVMTEQGRVEAERVVVALGPWSSELTERFGYRIPLLRKRGYHRHFTSSSGPNNAMLDVDNATFMSPMNQGLRVCTGAEITQFDAPADLRQISRAEQAAREFFELGERVESSPWIGHRPCLPDMLPVIGAAPRHKGLWFHFGHAHQGFTGGPAAAQLLMELMVDGKSPDWAAHFSPARFG